MYAYLKIILDHLNSLILQIRDKAHLKLQLP